MPWRILQALVLVLLGHTHHQAQVGGHHPVAGPLGHAQLAPLLGCEAVGRQLLQLLAGLHMVGQLNLLGGSEQGHPADGAEIPADGIAAEAP
jgi:hypothetical protein